MRYARRPVEEARQMHSNKAKEKKGDIKVVNEEKEKRKY